VKLRAHERGVVDPDLGAALGQVDHGTLSGGETAVDSDPGLLAGLPASGTIFLSEERHGLHFCDGTTGPGYRGNSYDSVFIAGKTVARKRNSRRLRGIGRRYSSSGVANR